MVTFGMITHLVGEAGEEDQECDEISQDGQPVLDKGRVPTVVMGWRLGCGGRVVRCRRRRCEMRVCDEVLR